MSTSKFKNAIGEDKKEKFTHCNLSQISTDGRLIAINSSFLAMSWSNEGEIVVLDSNTPSSARQQEFKIKGHRANVLDLEFSPFCSDLLASTFDDNEILLYKIPEGGLKEHITKEVQIYRKHARKVPCVNFNPVAADVVCSGAFTGELHVWSSIKGDSFVQLKADDTPSLVTWNPNGSLIGTTTKSKTMNIFDPRTKEMIFKKVINEGIQAAKFAWTSNDTFATCSWDKIGQKNLRLWDIKNLDKEISSYKIDSSKTITTVFADRESKLLYTVGKGEATTHVFDYESGVIYKGIPYASKEPSLFQIMQERKCVDYNKLEVDRFARYVNTKNIYIISFTIPRRNPGFDPTLYPPLECGEPAMTYDEWASGKTSEPVKKDVTEIVNKFVSNEQKFEKQEVKVEKPKTSESMIKELEAKISEYTQKIKKISEENDELKKKIEARKLEKQKEEEKKIIIQEEIKEEPKQEEPKQEEPKQEEPKQEEPKQEEEPKKEEENVQQKVEEPEEKEEVVEQKVEEAPVEEPKEEPKVEEPPVEEPKEEPKVEEPPAEEPKEEPKPEEPPVEEPKPEEPPAEEPKEEPKPEEPPAEEPKEEPKPEEPPAEEPKEEPKPEEPPAEEPKEEQ